MIGQSHPETNAITIKPKTVSHTAEQFSWVPLPTAFHPGALSQKNLLLCQHVSPQTIHFRVLDKSPVSGPGRGRPSCNTHASLSQDGFYWRGIWVEHLLTSLPFDLQGAFLSICGQEDLLTLRMRNIWSKQGPASSFNCLAILILEFQSMRNKAPIALPCARGGADGEVIHLLPPCLRNPISPLVATNEKYYRKAGQLWGPLGLEPGDL